MTLKPYLFINFGQGGAMSEQDLTDSRVAIPRPQMQGVAPLVVNHVCWGLIG